MRLKSRYFNLFTLFNLSTILFLIALPYYLFEGKLFIGGDDTRLFYAYPKEFLINLSFFSWANFSSLGYYLPNHQSIPFLSLWFLLDKAINSKIILDYFSFSLPLILGFIYFQKFIKELIDKNRSIRLLSALIYIFSPIMVANQLSVFLASVWLIGLIPILGFYFLRFYKTANFLFIYIAMIWCIIFSIGLYSIPWFFGLLLPLIIGIVSSAIFFSLSTIKIFIKRALIFMLFVALSQLFWLISFFATFINIGAGSLGGNVISKSAMETFRPTVVATATGNIIYPLLNIPHRQIAFDFDWQSKGVFTNFYDKFYFLNSIYIVLVFLGIQNIRKVYTTDKIKIYLIFFVSFITSLFLFTVNIGPFKNLFLLFGYLPGFVIFRNFYDKFALGYVFLYTIVIAFSFVIIKKKYPYFFNILLFLTLVVLFINLIPMKAIINSTLWTTKSVYKTVNIPMEYEETIASIKQNVPVSTNIFSLPYNGAAYSVIAEGNNNAYVGTSPVKFFTGINDLSGSMSFPPYISDKLEKTIRGGKYSDIIPLLQALNINYIFLTKNVPLEVQNSYLFDRQLLRTKNDDFIKTIADRKLYTSSKGNYELYLTKKRSHVLESDNLYFQKINSVKYKIYIKNLKPSQEIIFKDTFHAGWKLYVQKKPNMTWCNKIISKVNSSYECDYESKLFEFGDLFYLISSSVFEKSHNARSFFGNKWSVNMDLIKKSGAYKENSDGSIDVELVLYFLPQNYFYIGVMGSIASFLGSTYYVFKKRKDEK